MQSQQLLASCVTTLAQRAQRATKVRTRFRELELPTRPVRLGGGTTRRTLLPFSRAQVRDGAFVALKALYLEDETTPQAAPPVHPPCVGCLLPPLRPASRAALPPLRHSTTPPSYLPPLHTAATLAALPLLHAHAARVGVLQVAVILAEREQSLRSWRLAGAMMNLVLLHPQQRRGEDEQPTRSAQPQAGITHGITAAPAASVP